MSETPEEFGKRLAKEFANETRKVVDGILGTRTFVCGGICSICNELDATTTIVIEVIDPSRDDVEYYDENVCAVCAAEYHGETALEES